MNSRFRQREKALNRYTLVLGRMYSYTPSNEFDEEKYSTLMIALAKRKGKLKAEGLIPMIKFKGVKKWQY